MKLLNLLSTCLVLALSCVAAATASVGAVPLQGAGTTSHRVALVIGNGAYPSAPLTNPANDARAVASALRSVGFEVIELEDAGKAAMKSAMRQMTERLHQTKGVGLFYFAGHGIQVSGSNYLLPVDKEFSRPSHVRTRALDLNWVLDEMDQAGNGVNIVILDACRNNPIVSAVRSARSGLAEVQAPTGTYIAFATAPGGVALDGSNDSNHSVYTKHLIANLTQPGMTIEQVFKQVRVGVLADTDKTQQTWDSSSLTGEFYFVDEGGQPAASSVAPVLAHATKPAGKRATSTDANVQLAMWKAAQRQRDPALYQAYLTMFPDGTYARLATILLQRTRQATDASAAQMSKQAPQTLAQAGAPKQTQRSYSAPAKPGPNDIPGMLASARRALAVNRLLRPTNDNAMFWAKKVLAKDPGNTQADALTKKVVARYLSLTERALATGQVDKANTLAQRAMTLQKYASQEQIQSMAVLLQQVSTKRVAGPQPSRSAPGAAQSQAGDAPVPSAGHRESTTAENIAAMGLLFKGLGEGIGNGARAFILPF